MTAKELREKRAALAKQIRQMADAIGKESRDFNSEEQPNWEKLNKDYDGLGAQIGIAERAEKIDAEQRTTVVDTGNIPGREDRDTRNEPNGDDNELTPAELGLEERQVKPEVFRLAIAGWILRANGYDLEERHHKAARAAQINIGRPYLDLRLNKRAAMSAVDLSAGASTIVPTFQNSLERALLAFGGIRSVAQVMRTETGANLLWPTANDTGNKGHIVGENTAAADTPVTTGGLELGAFKYTSDMIKVPFELLEDSAFDLPSEIGSMGGERIGRRQADDFTTGNAAGKPQGVIAGSSLGKTAAATTAFTADELLDLVHSVDIAYRANAQFMFADLTLAAIRKLKDGNGRYLFQAATDGAPDTIWDRPYTVNNSMSSTFTTGQKLVAFGDFSKYKIRDVRALRLMRLNERFADSDQVGFVAFLRSDGGVLNAGVAPIKYLALA